MCTYWVDEFSVPGLNVLTGLDWVKVALYQDPKQACLAVVKEAQRLWLKYETRTDDITIIVVHVDGLKDVRISSFLVQIPLLLV
jgi:hypothetical protein